MATPTSDRHRIGPDAGPPVQRHAQPTRGRDGDGAGRHPAAAAGQGPAALHRSRVERGRPQTAKLYTGNFEVVSFDRSWHGMTSGASGATYSSGRRGYGPAIPGNLTLPTPNAYRSPFRLPDGG